MIETRIIRGNSKLGKNSKIYHVSLPPILSCSDDVPCSKNGCYARKEQRFKNVKEARRINWELYHSNPDKYFSDIYDTIKIKNIKEFRWNCAGDFCDQQYLDYVLSHFIYFLEKFRRIMINFPTNL